MTLALTPGDIDGPDHGDDAACWQAAKQLRAQHPGWVIIWLARIRRYRARPLFRAPRDTVLTAQTTEELAAQMDRAEQAARRPRTRSRQMPGVRPQQHQAAGPGPATRQSSSDLKVMNEFDGTY
jgi:hypothetical protein